MSTKQHDETEVCDAGFTAADMATAAARGFRDGQAAQATAGQDPVATVFTMEALTPGAGVKYHATVHKPLPAGTKLYTHPQLAAQDAERKPLSKEQRAEIMEEVDSYNFPEDLIDATEKAHGIKGGQHDV